MATHLTILHANPEKKPGDNTYGNPDDSPVGIPIDSPNDNPHDSAKCQPPMTTRTILMTTQMTTHGSQPR
jgi:hypothetical protein